MKTNTLLLVQLSLTLCFMTGTIWTADHKRQTPTTQEFLTIAHAAVKAADAMDNGKTLTTAMFDALHTFEQSAPDSFESPFDKFLIAIASADTDAERQRVKAEFCPNLFDMLTQTYVAGSKARYKNICLNLEIARLKACLQGKQSENMNIHGSTKPTDYPEQTQFIDRFDKLYNAVNTPLSAQKQQQRWCSRLCGSNYKKD